MDLDDYKYFEEANPGVVRLLPTGQRVLDVGCGYGALAPELTARDNFAVGIDVNETALAVARDRYDEIYCQDLEVAGDDPLRDSDPFDCIIFGDVLEHVYDPLAVLKQYVGYLKTSGEIIVSIPNVVTWPVRLAFLFGRFNYTATGTLDWTHIRFFTRETTRQLLADAGLRIVRFTVTPNLARTALRLVRGWYLRGGGESVDSRAITDSSGYRFYIRYVYPLELLIARLWPGMLAFQFVYVAVPAETDGRESVEPLSETRESAIG